MPMARLAIQEKWRVNLLPESVNHSLLDNFPEKEISYNRGKLTLSVQIFAERLPATT